MSEQCHTYFVGDRAILAKGHALYRPECLIHGELAGGFFTRSMAQNIADKHLAPTVGADVIVADIHQLSGYIDACLDGIGSREESIGWLLDFRDDFPATPPPAPRDTASVEVTDAMVHDAAVTYYAIENPDIEWESLPLHRIHERRGAMRAALTAALTSDRS